MRALSQLKSAFALFSVNRSASRGAAIAFYAVTSFAPVLLIVIAVAGLVFGREAASGLLFGQLRSVLGPAGADFLQKTLASASGTSANVIAGAIGLVTLIATASGVFLELEDALNALWQTEPRAGIVAMAKQRLTSLALVFGLGVLLLVSLAVDAGLHAMSSVIDAYLPFGNMLLMALNIIVALMLMTVLFAAIFKFVPARRPKWREILAGAAVTAVLFEIGKFLIGMYLGSRSAASSLGAAGALLGVLFWIYYSAQIFLFGAALTRARVEALNTTPPGPH
jgi:membrane protein